MNADELKCAVARISEMEHIFDSLQAAWRADPAAFCRDKACMQALDVLLQYYQDGRWLADYMLDEQGLLPPELKRGVLSQDALWNFLCEIGPENSEK